MFRGIQSYLLFALVVCAITLVPISLTTSENSSRRPVDSIEIAATGDVLLHVPVQVSATLADRKRGGESVNHGGYDVVFSHVADELRRADIAFANLETPLAPDTGHASIPFVFNAPKEVGGALEAAGIDVISFANNHVYDQKRAGLVETLDHLEETELRVAGAGRTCPDAYAPRWVEVRTFRVAFLAATQYFNANDLNKAEDEPCVAALDEERILDAVAGARRDGADVIVLSVHWGAEYHTEPSAEIREMAHRFVDGGVDVILGHHPHVLQPVEAVRAADGRDALIAYSLGNFVSNQAYDYVPSLHPVRKANTRDGAIVRFRVARVLEGAGRDARMKLELTGVRAIPLWTHNDYLLQITEPGPRYIRVFRLADVLADLESQVGPPRQRARTRWSPEVFRRRQYEVARILGRDVVSYPVPPRSESSASVD